MAQAAVGISMADLAFVEREGVLLNVAERLVFCFPQVTVFIESVLDIALEFKGNIELGAVSTQSSFFVRSIALRLADIVELEVEVVSEDLLAAGKAVLIVIAEQLVDLVDVERFLAAQQSAAAVLAPLSARCTRCGGSSRISARCASCAKPASSLLAASV